MANLNLAWVLPTQRESGKPLAVDAIAKVRVELSADGGANYGFFGEFPNNVLETTITDLEPGTWFVRGIVIDTAGRASQPYVSSYTIEDTTPPGALKSLTLTLG